MLAPRYRVNGRAFARIAELHPELTAFRRDLHAHPELGFEEVYTAARVAAALKACGRGRNSHRDRQDRRRGA